MENSSQGQSSPQWFRRILSEAGSADTLLDNIFAGTVTGLLNALFSVSYAALIFSGPMTKYLPFGVSSGLISATVLALVVALSSSFRFGVGGPDLVAAAIIAFVVNGAASTLIASGQQAALLPTVIVLLGVSTLTTGIVLLGAGLLRLGRWIRYSPYPVIAGFLASTGWLLFRGATGVMLDTVPQPGQLDVLFQTPLLFRWLPGLLFALTILFVTHRFHHHLLMPGLILGGIGVFYLLLWVNGISLKQAAQYGWLLETAGQNQFWWTQSGQFLDQINWSVLVDQVGNILALIFVMVIVMLLNATGIELDTGHDANLDAELQSSGAANIAAGLFGGIIGGLSTSRTLVNFRAGASTSVSGLTTALVCGAILFFGTSWLAYLPKPIIGGLLLYVGLMLLIRWLYMTWFQLKLEDYAIIWFILMVTANIGFLQGIGLGVVIASVIFTVTYSRYSVVKYELSGADHQSNYARSIQEQRLLQKHGRFIHIMWLQGYLFFGTATTLLEAIRTLISSQQLNIQFLILDFRQVSGLDASALLSFKKLRRVAASQQVVVLYTNLADDIRLQFELSDILDGPASANVFPDLDRGLEWCEEQILNQFGLTRHRFVPLALQLEDMFLSTQQVNRFMEYLEFQEIPENHVFIEKGVQSNALYFLEHGQVTVVGEIGTGQTRRIRTMSSGEIVGELGFYRHTAPMASVITDQPTRIYSLTREALTRMEQEDPVLAASFHRFIAALIANRLVTTSEALDLLIR